MIRKIFIAKFLITIWIFRFCFMHLAYQYERGESRENFENIKQHLNANKIETFVFENITAIEWENENEFELNDQMYDVISISRTGSKIVIKCISDEKESELIRSFQRIFQNDRDNKSEDTHKIIFENVKYLATENTQFKFAQVIYSRTNSYKEIHYLSQIKLVLQLPPEKFGT